MACYFLFATFIHGVLHSETATRSDPNKPLLAMRLQGHFAPTIRKKILKTQ